MNRREQLQDQYEDALFALLMDEIATAEGKKANEENERLKNDPSAAVPVDVDKRCLQTIRRHFAKQRAYTVGRFTVKAMKRVVMAAGLAALFFTGAFATSETVRVHTLNLIVEVFDTDTAFMFTGNSANAENPRLAVGWIPDGYTLEEKQDDDSDIMYEYRNHDNALIRITCRNTNGMAIGIDTENAEVTYVEVKNLQAMLVQKEGELQLAWAVKDNSEFITIVGSDIRQEDIIHIANELIY